MSVLGYDLCDMLEKGRGGEGSGEPKRAAYGIGHKRKRMYTTPYIGETIRIAKVYMNCNGHWSIA